MEKIWGIGPATTNYLARLDIRMALAFAQLLEKTVRDKFTKPGVEIWQELRGESVYPVITEGKSSYASISKTKTFAPATSDADYLFAQLMRNMESACIKARRYALAPRKIVVFLKKNNFDWQAARQRFRAPAPALWNFPVSSAIFSNHATARENFTALPVLSCLT